jgi:hypothetical protein
VTTEEGKQGPDISPLQERWLLVLALLIGALLLLRPIWPSPFELALGAQASEAPRHFWGLWAVASQLTEHGPFVAHLPLDHPSGYSRHLMDPINLVFFLPGYFLGGGEGGGAILGWNLVHAAWPLLGGLGGYLLARRLLGAREGAAAGALMAGLACATGPYLLATPWLGRSELLPGAAWPLQLWMMDRALSERGRLREAISAGLLLALISLGGWYLAAWMALLTPPIALWMSWRRKGRRAWSAFFRPLGLAALCALLPVLPALSALLEHPPPILSETLRVSVHSGICTPPWLLLPFTGSQGLPGTDLAAYPGTVLMLLALLGAWRVRSARAWLGIGGLLLLLSLGPYLVWSNDAAELQTEPLSLPAQWLEALIPPLRYIWGWCRLGILLTAPLAMAAAYGVAWAWPRMGRLRGQGILLIAVVMVMDHGSDRQPAGVEGSAFDPAPPSELSDALDVLPPGAILQLPFDDAYMSWQLFHGRPVAESLEIEDARELSWLVQRMNLAIDQSREGIELPDLESPQAIRCGEIGAAQLFDAGFSLLVLHRNRLPELHTELGEALERMLGPPAIDGPTLSIWQLSGAQGPERSGCEPQRVELIIPGGAPSGSL